MSGGSRKQLDDALKIYEVQGEFLEKDYINFWALKLNISDLWEKIVRNDKLT
jgi:hypothetical protein